jgi:hypothetical protein
MWQCRAAFRYNNRETDFRGFRAWLASVQAVTFGVYESALKLWTDWTYWSYFRV